MNVITILDFASLFFAGILAGVEFVIHYGLQGTTDGLDDQSQLKFRQALVLKLRVLVPAFFAPAALLGIALTFLNSSAPGFVFRCAGVAALLVWVLLRVVGTVPINSATLEWQPASPPVNWKSQIDHSERFHIIGTWSAVLTFAFFLIAVALKLVTH